MVAGHGPSKTIEFCTKKYVEVRGKEKPALISYVIGRMLSVPEHICSSFPLLTWRNFRPTSSCDWISTLFLMKVQFLGFFLHLLLVSLWQSERIFYNTKTA